MKGAAENDLFARTTADRGSVRGREDDDTSAVSEGERLYPAGEGHAAQPLERDADASTVGDFRLAFSDRPMRSP